MSLKFTQEVQSARILSVGAYRPPRVVPNSEIIGRIDSTDEWIQQRTGIVSRHIAAADESLIDMAEKSALIAIKRAGLTAQDIDAVIFATISYPYQAPSAATELLVRLGNVKAAAFDLSAACAGFCYGVALANDLVRKISGEVLYIDPPYNGRQYLGNYHVLESIAKYDNPILKGKTGTREDMNKVSDYCKKGKVAQSFDDLLANANFDYVFISYSTEGLLTEEELVSIAEKHSDPKKLKVYKFPYRRYSRIKDDNKPTVHEIVVSAAK